MSPLDVLALDERDRLILRAAALAAQDAEERAAKARDNARRAGRR